VSNAPYRYQVSVRLHAPAEVVSARTSPTSSRVEPVDECTCRFHVGVPSLEQVPLHLARLGVDFEIIQPPELVEHVRAMAERLRHAVP